MQPRLLSCLASIARRAPRHSATALSAALLVIAGSGAIGVHALRADDVTSPPAASPSPDTSPLPDANAGAKNIVQVKNFEDGRLKVEGRIQLGHEPGPQAGPVNIALAYSSCTDCQTLAVALQINLVNRNASVITPQNAAVAVNGACTR